jgi:hypothetical protein
MTTMSKTFTFPKVAYTSSRRVNLPTIEVELRKADTDKPELSICGNLWNSSHTDIVMGCQCLDEMSKLGDLRFNTLFKKLRRLWKLYHLNDMHAGSRSQEDALIAEFGKIPDYNKACEYLKSIDLYKDENDYVYGSAWQYREIPAEDLNEIISLLAG